MFAVLNERHVTAQQVTNPAPSGNRADLPERIGLPDDPGAARYPQAVPVPVKDDPADIVLGDYDTLTGSGDHWVADGHVVLKYQGHTVEADHIEYDRDTGEVRATGHLVETSSVNMEHIVASHGTMNITAQTGRFYDVTGSVGFKSAASGKPGSQRMVYANDNPFLFTGKMVVKTGPETYDVYEGTVTSCQLPRPDWLLSAAKFHVEDDQARAKNSVFRLMNIPVFYFPYVTHPLDADSRESGLMIPEVGDSSSKGLVFGEQVFWAVNRSTDITAGAIYYSMRGWEESGTFRYRGLGSDILRAHFSALEDRGYIPSGGTYINQSGQDVTFLGRRDFFTQQDSNRADATPASPNQAATPPPETQTRTVADVEYLSSFPYREAFSTNFNQAVSSDVVSTIFGTHEWNGFAASVEGDRYQGEKRVATTTLPEEQVHIFHVPALEFTTDDHNLGSTGLEWSLDSSATGLKRSQPNFVTSGMVERLDVRPEMAYPLALGGWHVRSSVAVRDTFYSRSRIPANQIVSPVPVESMNSLNRADFEAQVEIRPPVLERTFDSGFLKKLLRHDFKHTIEPEVTYRYVSGIGNFLHVLRFDTVDVMSDTNEVEYGATQRLYLRRKESQPCRAPGTGADATEMFTVAGALADEADGDGTKPDTKVCGNREWISWRLTQKAFIDPSFGGAIQDGRRNILDTTLSFSGIAFLTEPRQITPLVSRLLIRPTEKTDVEWDFDYDAGAKKFTASNVYVDVHQGSAFAGVSYARLNAPGRSYSDGIASADSNFSQLRVLAGYGKPTKGGFSVAGNAALDLNLGSVQYGAIQSSYNWNCCGLSVEYRKYELGTARNENEYRFNFTLANIGTAGNIRRAEQLF
jgi:LPS-assembly protein